MPGLEVKAELAPLAGERAGGLGPPVAVEPHGEGAPRRPADVVFGDSVRLAGFAVEPAELSAGQTATVTLFWQPTAPLVEDWTTFAQIVNANGDKVGQSDHRPGGEHYPSSRWAVGEELRDSHAVTLAADLGPGPYRLLVGLYTPEGGGLRYLGEPQFVGEVR
jgi:hypothetical protein